MGFTEREIFVHFEMKFDEEIALLLVSGDVVNGMTHALGDGANGFEKVLVVRSARLGVNDDIGGNNLANALLDGVGERVDAFEIGGTRDGNGGVDEMAIARAADTDTFNAENAFHVADGIRDFVLQAFGSSVEKRVERAATEL